MDQNFDFLNFKDNENIKTLIKNEELILSCKIFKINHKGVRQERTLLLSNSAIYNMNKKKIKRRIDLEKILAVSYSNLSCEFVIHFEKDYDIRYSSHDLRIDIIKCIFLILENYLKKDYLNIYYLDMINLNSVTKTKKLMKSNKKIDIKSDSVEKMNYKNFLEKHNLLIKKKTIIRQKTKTILKPTKNSTDVCMDDFDLIKVLGKGAFGKVVLAEKIDNQKLYAIKILKKNDIIETDQLEHTKAEKMILSHVNHPFLVNLDYCFQNEEKVYFVLEFMKGGELFQHLVKAKKFDEKRTKFYISCIILALGHLHNKNYIYRDLKLENLLLDEKGYCKLTDFGLAKFITSNEKALTFCGTPEYLSPEVILGKGHNRPADWWSLGILTYEMIFGLPPFYSKNNQNMFKKIVKDDLVFRNNVEVSKEAKDFISKLLIKDQKLRLGSQGDSLEIMNHEWFKEIDWSKLMSKKTKSPFIPSCEGNSWINNFDEEFTKQEVRDSETSEIDLNVLKDIQDEFKDFNYSK